MTRSRTTDPMEPPDPTHPTDPTDPGNRAEGGDGAEDDFRVAFEGLFDLHFPRLFRYFDRLTGDPDLASDLAQEAFVKLYRRGSLPDEPEAWLVSVAMNLFRNARRTGARRSRILAGAPVVEVQGEGPPSPAAAVESEERRRRVRRALDRLPERERSLLVLRTQGYSYRELAQALDLEEASVGTLLARARDAFRRTYGEVSHAH